ncbi:extracellular catalytic domain type 1 short-chain-length polyhydroxyalkanoate depolymerase [Variovorax sp. PBL-E5]|uniref:extracellular catalytic domain type 1 short-chain-length polyhydroxyalkanoate depolymerase n=1 Tax=Variovorax sp. PBL-E5 TaxID=434014 RepID=UPI00131627E3|nr:PHB depolymerase family esterase [Variovorax sp. PBL-E5]VTU18783.1 esterase, PHB depolymerase family [Variovorax sp. PBL-E5]
MNSFLERLGRAIRRLLSGLGRAAPPLGPDQWTDGTFSQQGRAIAYKLFVPARGTGTPRPLVVMLHGCTQNPEDFATGTGMNRLAAERGFLVLYPAQSPRANAGKCWNWFITQHQRADRGEPALLAALTREVIDLHAADPGRVYVAGLSAGGAMADILGRTHPELFAAVGVHSGLTAGAAHDLMSALAVMKDGPAAAPADAPAVGPAPPTIVFHGDADGTVHPLNGERVVAAALAQREGGAAVPQQSEGRSPQGQAFTRRQYADARGRIDVEAWLLHGAGHAWAGGSAAGSFTDPAGPDASAEMLRFFLAHPMPKRADKDR